MSEAAKDTYTAPEHGWTCLHCGETFPGNAAGQYAAREHFGPQPDSKPGCRLRMHGGEKKLLRWIRYLERELRELKARVLEEDTDKDRQMAAILTSHARELLRQEEIGYMRGVLDMTCSDCPPPDYPTDKTRCAKCPRRRAAA